uniref:DNA polymerase III subunit delta n=1 Tax=Paulinella chromatophora TaxID=39717 RepID=B1X4L5_PAUCH|nr:hypothetical protein PCC_0445 [Paulinella chromatophora]ACB42884.1 hypothetical protein PCC_0445 [Paulinella chromatophora]
MPVYIYWGDDEAAIIQSIKTLIKEVIHPLWLEVNLSRFDGNQNSQTIQALEECITPPFGDGGRVTIINNNPFCNQCSSRLSNQLETSLKLIPEQCYLILISLDKPKAFLQTNKLLKKIAIEQKFMLPALWDYPNQKELVRQTIHKTGLRINNQALEVLSTAVGKDSMNLKNEIEKLALYSGHKIITAEAVVALIYLQSTNNLEIGIALIKGQIGEAISLIDILLDKNELGLRIVSALSSLIRGWLWVSLFYIQGEKDVVTIAKATGISNPKRIYIMHKQIKDYLPECFIPLLHQLLEVEFNLKQGINAKQAFRDGFLIGINR